MQVFCNSNTVAFGSATMAEAAPAAATTAVTLHSLPQGRKKV